MLRGSGEENKAQKRVPPEAKCENIKCEVIRVTETRRLKHDGPGWLTEKSKEEENVKNTKCDII